MERYDFALVGGGIVGACLAEELAGAGASVTVLDAGAEPGHATNRAAGVAVPSLRYLADPELYGWLQWGRGRLAADIDRLEPAHAPFSVPSPILRALRTVDVEAVAAHLDAPGHGEWIEVEKLASVAPGLRLPADRHYLFDRAGLMVDGRRYLAAVHHNCLAAGVRWRQGVTVAAADGGELRTSAGAVHADRVVVTAGAWSAAAGLAGGAPVYPQRGQLAVLRTGADLTCILSSAFYLAPGVNGGVVVGATEEDAGFDDRCTVAGISRLLRFAATAMPELADASPVELRAGLRPASRTGRPLVGRVPGHDRLYLAAGHAGHGLLSARGTAEGLAAGLVRDDWDALPESFCPSRALEA
ncbi:glycine oxidase ThiO [Streptosporangium fragile]|uniref:Glycine oxidase ThiO n=1 Tax=Streptosporangium fragile TaxID=46186 RepID=A0ABP6IR50_9ACTN